MALTAVDRTPEIASHLALFTLPDARPSQGPAFARTLERLFASPLTFKSFISLRQTTEIFTIGVTKNLSSSGVSR